MLRARVANWILKCAVAPADREAAIGDLAEEFEIRMRRGSRVDAAYWYWSQVLRSIPWFLWTPVRRGGWFGTLFLAFAACGVQAVLELVTACRATVILTPSRH
jgi:hypothetical protein